MIEIIYLKYLKADISYENVTRVERYPYPKDAVREGLYNALIHSNYQVGSPIQIRIDDESLTISNDCIFPSEWTEKTLFETHKSIQNNPHIASAFYRA